MCLNSPTLPFLPCFITFCSTHSYTSYFYEIFATCTKLICFTKLQTTGELPLLINKKTSFSAGNHSVLLAVKDVAGYEVQKTVHYFLGDEERDILAGCMFNNAMYTTCIYNNNYNVHNMSTCTGTQTRTHKYTNAHTHAHAYAHVHTHAHAHAHTHTHTHTHTCKHICSTSNLASSWNSVDQQQSQSPREHSRS